MKTPELEDEAEAHVDKYLSGRIADTFQQLHRMNAGESEIGAVVRQEAVEHFNRGIDLFMAGKGDACEFHAFIKSDGKIVYEVEEKEC